MWRDFINWLFNSEHRVSFKTAKKAKIEVDIDDAYIMFRFKSGNYRYRNTFGRFILELKQQGYRII